MPIESVSPRERKPDPSLLTYYALGSLLLGPLFFFPLIPLYFRYHTMVYHFDDEGVSMRWGILFRREISLTYSRIQDIHLSSNFVERWLGLARIQVQTASGSAGAEMTIEGLKDFEAIRDDLYSKMRGVKEHARPRSRSGTGPAAAGTNDDELALLLREIASELRGMREDIERQASRGEES